MSTRRVLTLVLVLIAASLGAPHGAAVAESLYLNDCARVDPDQVVPTGCVGGGPRSFCAGDVVACITPGTVFLDVPMSLVSVVPGGGPTHDVIGSVDVYRFVLPGGVITTLPCVVLTVDGDTTDPCLEAGGTFDRRLFGIQEPVAEPQVGSTPWISVRICNATLRVTVEGIGIESAPAYAVC